MVLINIIPAYDQYGMVTKLEFKCYENKEMYFFTLTLPSYYYFIISQNGDSVSL